MVARHPPVPRRARRRRQPARPEGPPSRRTSADGPPGRGDAIEDKKVKERIDARTASSRTCTTGGAVFTHTAADDIDARLCRASSPTHGRFHNMKNTLDDDEKGVADKRAADDKEESRTRSTRPSTGSTRTPRPTRTVPSSRRRSRRSRIRSCAMCTRAPAGPGGEEEEDRDSDDESPAPFPHVKRFAEPHC